MTEGRRRLLAVLQVIKSREVALRVHVSQAAVSAWSAGTWKPSKRARAMLAQHVGIDAVLWDQRARRSSSIEHARARL